MAYDPNIDYKAMAAGKSDAEIAQYAQANGFSAADIGAALGTTAADVTNRGYDQNAANGYNAGTALSYAQKANPAVTSNGTPTAANAWQTTYDPTRNADYRALAQGRSDQEIAQYAKNMNMTADQVGSVFGGSGADATARGYSQFSLGGYNAPTGILGKANAPGNNGVATQNTIIGNTTVDQYGRGIDRSYAPGDSRNVFSANVHSDQAVKEFLAQNPGMTPAQYISNMQKYGVDLNQLARVTGIGQQQLMGEANKAGITNADLRRGGILTNAAGMYDTYSPSAMNGVNPTAANPGGLVGPGQTAPSPGTPIGSPGGAGLPGATNPAPAGGNNGNLPPGLSGVSGSSSSSSGGTPTLGNTTPWSVGGEQTVEGRVNNLMNDGSPLQQQARTQALEQMNARGLSNSSMAITAGQLAGYQAALPIAQADAATFAKAAGYNADQKNQFTTTQFAADQQSAMAQSENAVRMQIANMQADTTKYTANLDAATKQKLQEMSAKANTENNATQQSMSMYSNLQQGIATIMNGTIMDYNAKVMAVRNLIEVTKGGYDILSKVSGVAGLKDYLNFDFTGSAQVAIDQGFAPGVASNTSAPTAGILGSNTDGG